MVTSGGRRSLDPSPSWECIPCVPLRCSATRHVPMLVAPVLLDIASIAARRCGLQLPEIVQALTWIYCHISSGAPAPLRLSMRFFADVYQFMTRSDLLALVLNRCHTNRHAVCASGAYSLCEKSYSALNPIHRNILAPLPVLSWEMRYARPRECA